MGVGDGGLGGGTWSDVMTRVVRWPVPTSRRPMFASGPHAHIVDSWRTVIPVRWPRRPAPLQDGGDAHGATWGGGIRGGGAAVRRGGKRDDMVRTSMVATRRPAACGRPWHGGHPFGGVAGWGQAHTVHSRSVGRSVATTAIHRIGRTGCTLACPA